MNKAISDKLIATALAVREAEPWMSMDDSDIFALKASTGETIYISIFGNGGQSYAVSAYVGKESFQSLLKMENAGDINPRKISELGMEMDFIKCDFDNASLADPDCKKLVQEYKKRYGAKTQRAHGWPSFARLRSFLPQSNALTDEDATLLNEAMEAAIFATTDDEFRYVLTNQPDYDNYPTARKPKTIPLMQRNAAGGYDISTTKTPLGMSIEPPTPTFKNDLLAFRLKQTKKKGTLVARMLLLPLPAQSKDGKPSHPGIIFLFDKEGDDVETLPIFGYPYDMADILADIARKMLTFNPCPATIESHDAKTLALIDDMCRQCGINLEESARPDADAEMLCDEAYNNMMYNMSFDFDDE